MATRYLYIHPEQEPYDLGIDNEGRPRAAFNITAFKRPSQTFLEELAAILVTAGVGVIGTSIGGSSKKEIPALTGAETFISLIETSGFRPVYTQERVAPAYKRPAAMVVVRAVEYDPALAKAWQAYNAFSVVRNLDVTV